jgi:serine/threonine protein kinase
MDYIFGDSLAGRVADIEQDHRTYFYETLPEIMADYIRCVEAVRFLHEHGEKHGDIRRDHILIDTDSGHYRWIDFDYNYRHRENIYGYDLFGLGNVLIYVVGKGDVLLPDLRVQDPGILPRLTDEDFNIVFHNRVANLQKVFPYIPDSLNRVLLHFSRGANWFYEHTTQLIQDLQQAVADIR